MIKNELLFTDARKRYSSINEDSLKAIDAIYRRGRAVYGPKSRANTEGLPESTFSLEPRSEMDGTLGILEIKAVLMIHNQVRELIALLVGGENEIKVREVLGISNDAIPNEILAGMADFIWNVSCIAKVREIVIASTVLPGGARVYERALRRWCDRFAQKVIDDGFRMGARVVRELVVVTEELRTRNVVTDEEIIKWSNYSCGVRLASELYLSVLE